MIDYSGERHADGNGGGGGDGGGNGDDDDDDDHHRRHHDDHDDDLSMEVDDTGYMLLESTWHMFLSFPYPGPCRIPLP